MLLLLCLLLTALTATVLAEGATDFSYFNMISMQRIKSLLRFTQITPVACMRNMVTLIL